METIFSKGAGENLTSKGDYFLHAMSQLYISIAVLDLDTSVATVLSSQFNKELVGLEIPWEKLAEQFVERHVYQEDWEAVYSLFSLPGLALFCDSEVNEKCVEIRFQQTEETGYEWSEIAATVYDRAGRKLLITTKNISEIKLQKRVLDQFLYHQNCDFFILVNLAENNYKIFDVQTGLLPVPDMSCFDYTADMLKYNNQYVVKSEVDRINDLMSLESIKELLLNRDEYSFSCGVSTDSGEYRRAKVQFITFDRTKNLYIISRTDITQIYLEERNRNEQLVHALHAAQRDLLTGLYNQTTTEKIVSQMLASYQGELAAVMFIDVDNFKMVNDTLGHLTGNELLKTVANFLLKFAVKDAIAGRVGGDEFLLYLPGITSIQEVYNTGNAICGAFENFRQITGDLPISCSVGIALYPQDGLNYDMLVRKADQALYCAKRYGKNHYFLYSEEIKNHKYSTALSEID